MKTALITLKGNNKFLKQCFPGTKITKKSVMVGNINASFIVKAIKSIPGISLDHRSFAISPRIGGVVGHASTCPCEGCVGKGIGYEMELEGEFNSWSLSVKIDIF